MKIYMVGIKSVNIITRSLTDRFFTRPLSPGTWAGNLVPFEYNEQTENTKCTVFALCDGSGGRGGESSTCCSSSLPSPPQN